MKMMTHSFSFLGHFCLSKYCDVRLSTLDAAGRYIKAHKVVLAAASEKLEKLFDRVGTGDGPVTVRNIKFEVLVKIVEFMYSGRVEIDADAEDEDFQDGLDMLRVKVKEQVGQCESSEIQSIDVPFSEFENIPPLQSFLTNDLNLPSNNIESVANSVTVSNSSNLGTCVISELEMTSVSEVNHLEDKETIDNSQMQVLNPCFAAKEFTSSESELKVKEEASEDQNNNLSEENVILNASPQCSRVKCSFCGIFVIYEKLSKHCRKVHPTMVNFTKKLCDICHRMVPFFCFEFHLLIFHREVSEKLRPRSNEEGLSCSKSRLREKGKFKRRIEGLPRNVEAPVKEEYLEKENKIKEEPLEKGKEINPRARIQFVMGKYMLKVEQKKVRKPILKSMKKFSMKVGVEMKFLKFKYRKKFLDGSELALEFDQKVIVVNKL